MSGMARWVKVHEAKHNNLSLTRGTHIIQGEKELAQLFIVTSTRMPQWLEEQHV